MQFFRRLFHRFRPHDDADGQADKNTLHCVVQYLDDSEANFNINKQTLGKDLYEQVYNDLDFQYEHEYFGLQYTDFHNVRYWLDPTKQLKKQIKKTLPGPPYTFRFVVKFYSCEPDTYLKEELTRYLYVLQLKTDLAEGRLTVNDEEKAAEMAALVIQSEEGDFDPDKHDLAFVSQFRFLPEEQQTEELEMMVLDEYKRLVDRNLTPALCEKMYLNKVKYLENYGVDMHKVQGKDDRSYQLGLTPAGILVYDGDEKIGFFFWQRILKIAFNRANLKIVVTEDDTQGAQQDHTFVFKLVDGRTCKHLWRCAVEHHSFFRLVQPKAAPSKTKQLMRLRSRFYHSFRTETGLVQANQFGTSQRRSARFERKPSTRHSCRPSFARADTERRLLRPERRTAQPATALVSAAAEVEDTNDSPQSDSVKTGRLETIETKAIVVSIDIPEEVENEPEAEFKSFAAVSPQAMSTPPKSPLSPTPHSTGGSQQPQQPQPSPLAAGQSSFSSSGQSDSSSAVSQRTVIEVATIASDTTVAAVAAGPSSPNEAEAVEPEAAAGSAKSPTPSPQAANARRPPQASGLRQPTAIPKSTTAAAAAPAAAAPTAAATPTAAPAMPTAAAATNGVGKSASSLPAPKVLAQKQPAPPRPPPPPPPATVSASCLPRRLSGAGAAAPVDAVPAIGGRPEEAAVFGSGGSGCGGSRIPGPGAGAGAPAPPRSRIPAPAPPPPPPPPQQTLTATNSGLPQPRAGGMSGIPRLAAAAAAAPIGVQSGPQFSLKL